MTTEVEEKKERKKTVMLSPKQWAEVRALWESGEFTLTMLSERFKVTRATLQRHFALRKVKKGAKSQEHEKKIAEEVAKNAVGDATVIAARIRETKEEHYKMASGLAKLTWNEVLQVKKNGAPMAAATNNLRALDAAMNVLKKAREERFAVLGLDRDDHVDQDGLPELVISELTADQIETLRNKQQQDDLGDIPDDDFVDEDEEVSEDDNG